MWSHFDINCHVERAFSELDSGFQYPSVVEQTRPAVLRHDEAGQDQHFMTGANK